MEKSFIYPLRYTNTFRGPDPVPGAGDPERIKTSPSVNDTRLQRILGKKMARGDLATVRWILSVSPEPDPNGASECQPSTARSMDCFFRSWKPAMEM